MSPSDLDVISLSITWVLTRSPHQIIMKTNFSFPATSTMSNKKFILIRLTKCYFSVLFLLVCAINVSVGFIEIEYPNSGLEDTRYIVDILSIDKSLTDL